MKRHRIVIIKDATGIDIPKSMIGRYGTITGRNKRYDECGKKAYWIMLDGYKRNRIFWEDEFREVFK